MFPKIGVTKSVSRFLFLKRCSEIRWFPKLVVSKMVLQNRCYRFFRETVVPQIGVTEFGDSKNGVTKSVFPFSFPKTVIPQIRVPEIGDPKLVFPFLGTILLHTLGFINRCPLVGLMSEKWTCNSSRQSFPQTKTLSTPFEQHCIKSSTLVSAF